MARPALDKKTGKKQQQAALGKDKKKNQVAEGEATAQEPVVSQAADPAESGLGAASEVTGTQQLEQQQQQQQWCVVTPAKEDTSVCSREASCEQTQAE
ncbi:hypothetical protein COCSUDRAFT_62731 [Coccomyxa subellipsoidea C-169]|uniref:Uncharacterized protein n=1 Tax=Coccomyxa subellipsoidea (strain C-169) TaxID=574566 RepID=I0Z0Q4_COCSC|nr:hypothetical protein COCSUDRAFT_62731 [Coccomyxa subellipsoidea C-169]EIE24223.1 hypothetical protein COCSUDRAFT_62731 [Coccomyxa subellipsoidea C-169]|eukprot:XP_005648767.1 hypothetical protein COCSUDRAFT_62731 [Coccomyxa subellipsoidea C-169]